MGFFEELANSFPNNFFGAEPIFKAVIFGDKGAYLQGVTGIKCFSAERVVLSVKKGEVEISGENLYISKYCEGDAVVSGEIKCVTKN